MKVEKEEEVEEKEEEMEVEEEEVVEKEPEEEMEEKKEEKGRMHLLLQLPWSTPQRLRWCCLWKG